MENDKIRILIVDDEESHIAAIRRSLESAPFRVAVAVAGSLKEYRRVWAESPPHVALVDMNLPDGRAMEVLTFPPEAGSFPVLIMTGCGDERTAVEAIKSGALDYVVKSPETFSSMPRIIERVIREWRLLMERRRGEERIEHLNRILRAVRCVERLIVREKDPEKLIADTCTVLTEHRGYRSAVIILTGEDGAGPKCAEAGVGAALHKLHECLGEGVLPLCCEQARANGGVFLASDQTETCRQCPVNINHGVRNSICIQLVHEELSFGYLMVMAAEKTAIDPEEQSLLLDMADDVAFALRNMAQEKAMERVSRERDTFQAELHQAQKMEAIGRLAGGVAHDFNNILTAIIGFSQIILNKLAPDSSLRQFTEMILAAAEKAAGLTQSLLAFSRKQAIKSKPADLNRIIDNISRLLARVIGEDIELKVDLHVDPMVAMVDEGQIEQVLMNLATNSRDAMPSGGIFSLATERLYLDAEFINICGCAEPGEYICIVVSDSGCGIPREIQEEMFEPFFTTKETGKGTGLGLSIVHGIVKQHGGFISVESIEGRGTTFRIYFPLLERVEVQRKAGSSTISVTGHETILLVEDDVQLLKLAQMILVGCGYSVLVAEGPMEACKICAQHPEDIALLITDVIMPVMNGKELQGKIEKMRPGIKTLFMSGYTADIIAKSGILEQGLDFLDKPFTPLALAEKTRMVLDGAAAHSIQPGQNG